jgi:hypothetical protein
LASARRTAISDRCAGAYGRRLRQARARRALVSVAARDRAADPRSVDPTEREFGGASARPGAGVRLQLIARSSSAETARVPRQDVGSSAWEPQRRLHQHAGNPDDQTYRYADDRPHLGLRPHRWYSDPTEPLNRTAAVKVAAKLLDLHLVQEVPAKLGFPIWRMDEERRAFSLKILKAGRAIVQPPSGSAKVVENTVVASASLSPTVRAKEQPAQGTAVINPASQPGSKREVVLAMLQRQGGASIGDLMAVTGWLPHSTRAALSGLRKTGVAIERSQDPQDQTSIYRITQSIPAVAA